MVLAVSCGIISLSACVGAVDGRAEQQGVGVEATWAVLLMLAAVAFGFLAGATHA